MVGGGYFVMSSYQCHYSVGSYDKRLSDQPLGHMIQYQAILTMKEKGRKTYLIGYRFYKENLPFVTEKQVHLSHFKQGFSSQIFPRIGLYFHSQRVANNMKNKKTAIIALYKYYLFLINFRQVNYFYNLFETTKF